MDADGNIVSQRSSSSSSVVALAIKGNKKSKYVVQWALNKFVPEGMIIFKLIHVHANIQGVPTPSNAFLCLISSIKYELYAYVTFANF